MPQGSATELQDFEPNHTPQDGDYGHKQDWVPEPVHNPVSNHFRQPKNVDKPLRRVIEGYVGIANLPNQVLRNFLYSSTVAFIKEILASDIVDLLSSTFLKQLNIIHYLVVGFEFTACQSIWPQFFKDVRLEPCFSSQINSSNSICLECGKNYGQDQCDKMATLFVQFGPFTTMKMELKW